VGEGERLLVVGCGWLDLWGLAVHGNIAEEAQGIRLVMAFLMFAGERQRPLGEGLRLFHAASQQMRLTQRETTERLSVNLFCCYELFDRLCEQCHGVGDAPA